MKTLHVATAIALTLFSAAALAERGSAEQNEVVTPSSSADQQTNSDARFTLGQLSAVNNSGDHTVILPNSSAQEQQQADHHIALGDLHDRNS